MAFEVWTFYVATVLALMSTPGPSQLLILSNSAAHGFQRSLATAAGDLSANAMQMLAAGLGLAALITASSTALTIIKWTGVAYLVWLGIGMIRRASPNNQQICTDQALVSLRSLWLQGFLTSAANPKAIVFFAALFPQFIQGDNPFWPQFIVLSLTYLILDGLFLSLYGYGASWVSIKFRGAAKAWVERIGGSCMILAAALLSLKTLSHK